MQHRVERVKHKTDVISTLKVVKSLNDMLLEQQQKMLLLYNDIKALKSKKFKIEYEYETIMLHGKRWSKNRYGIVKKSKESTVLIFWYNKGQTYIYTEEGKGYLTTPNRGHVLEALQGTIQQKLEMWDRLVEDRVDSLKSLEQFKADAQHKMTEFVSYYSNTRNNKVTLTEFYPPYTAVFGKTYIYNSYVIYIFQTFYYIETIAGEQEKLHRYFTARDYVDLLKQMNVEQLERPHLSRMPSTKSLMSKKTEIEINNIMQEIHELAACERRQISNNALRIWDFANKYGIHDVGSIFLKTLCHRWPQQSFNYHRGGSIVRGFNLVFKGITANIIIQCLLSTSNGDDKNVQVFYSCTLKAPFTRNQDLFHESGRVVRFAVLP
jgi:hypothetical protein